MDSFDENKIKDANMFSDIEEDTKADNENGEDFEFEDPEEAVAVSEMVKNIAEGGKNKPHADAEDDEEEWVVPETTLFTKLFSGRKKASKSKRDEILNGDPAQENVKETAEQEIEEAKIEEAVFEEPEEDDFFEIVKDEVEEIDDTEESDKAEETVDTEESEEAYRKEAAKKAAEEEEIKKEVQEMRSAVEDMMYIGETPEERESRHKKAAEIAALPVIDLSDIDFFSDDPGNGEESSDTVIDEIGEHLAMFVNDEISVKKKRWPKVVAGIAGGLILIVLFLLFTRPGHTLVSKAVARFIFSKVSTVDPSQNTRIDEQEALDRDKNGELVHADTPTPSPVITVVPGGETTVATPTPTPTVYVDYHPHYDPDPSVVNILLIGYENYEGYQYGRSDSMMIASIDKDGGPLKLVSLMRDMYVEIPGYNDNRLNAAYYFGGPELLLETIELNFGLVCDGYVIVDYSGFESIVDYIGGIEISLTGEESEYLNTTNYISNPKYRNTIPGNQILNGNQVVGYCRVRYVPTSNGLHMDFGRTYRQRIVMNKIFNKFKDANVTTLYNVMMECFKYVQCSENLEPIAAECIQTVVEKQMFKLDTYRIPVSGHYNETKIGGASVLAFDSDNADILHEYLYGE